MTVNQTTTLEDLFSAYPDLRDPATVANAMADLFGRDGFTDIETPFGTVRFNADADHACAPDTHFPLRTDETPDPPDGV